MVSEYMQSLETGWRDFAVTTKDGRLVESSWANVRLSDDTQIGVGVDVRERKRAEEELRKALAEGEEGRRILDSLMENVPEGITIADAPDARIRLVSRYGLEKLGQHQEMTAEEVAARWTVFEADGQTPMAAERLPLVRAIQRGEVVRNEELVEVSSSGERLYLSCSAAPIRDASGAIVGGVVTWRDVGEIREAQKALRESVERFRTLANNISQLAWMADAMGWIFWYN